VKYDKGHKQCIKDSRCEDRLLDRCHPATPLGGSSYDTSQSQFEDGASFDKILICDRAIIATATKKKGLKGGLPGVNQCVAFQAKLFSKGKYKASQQRCDAKVNGCYRACTVDTCNALPGCQALQQSSDPNDFYCQPVLSEPNALTGPYNGVKAIPTWSYSPGTPMVRFDCEKFTKGCSGGLVSNGQLYQGPVFTSPGQYYPGFNIITANGNANILAFNTAEIWLYRSTSKNAATFVPDSLLRSISPNEVCNVSEECCVRFRTFRVALRLDNTDSNDYKVVVKVNSVFGGGAIINPANPVY
jgi:hypothetical protein